jgi:hypothetical protein
MDRDNPMQSFLDGTLKPQLALISDSVVQPAFPVLREIIKRALQR